MHHGAWSLSSGGSEMHTTHAGDAVEKQQRHVLAREGLMSSRGRQWNGRYEKGTPCRQPRGVWCGFVEQQMACRASPDACLARRATCGQGVRGSSSQQVSETGARETLLAPLLRVRRCTEMATGASLAHPGISSLGRGPERAGFLQLCQYSDCRETLTDYKGGIEARDMYVRCVGLR